MTDEYLGKMLGVACEMAGADGATLFIVDGEVLRPYLVYRISAEYIEAIGPVRLGTQCCGRAVEHKHPWIVVDMLSDRLFAEGRAGALVSPVRAAFSVPVIDRGKVIASLACHFNRAHTPSAADLERNQAFANLFSIVLHTQMPLSLDRPYFVPAGEDTGNKKAAA